MEHQNTLNGLTDSQESNIKKTIKDGIIGGTKRFYLDKIKKDPQKFSDISENIKMGGGNEFQIALAFMKLSENEDRQGLQDYIHKDILEKAKKLNDKEEKEFVAKFINDDEFYKKHMGRLNAVIR